MTDTKSSKLRLQFQTAFSLSGGSVQLEDAAASTSRQSASHNLDDDISMEAVKILRMKVKWW